ncbi:selection and upkeep of intraepithelial T-cells protein 2-like [Xenopus laevis]|uniref:Selection and upkeep of intraepithelial T-cells protein 2-like n=1 Tax=Xenopus laevis TaxID=8355 RepID=A0A8J1LJA1_XENLA|nr:selection and upkeep of intraepithelial T-cells protein 2-like [Xenopus laevis]XP_041429658.1 selection and upkeep of intraepithelial T-cells protein 2-like [Xenopus laevis]
MIRAMPRLRITLFMGILTSLQISSAQRFDVTVTKTPVIASMSDGNPTGGAANLSCQVSPAVSAELMTIKFHRGDPKSYVYVYNKNPADSGTQNETYKDRTELLTENITRGQVTLRIKNVQLSDIGNYTCVFASSGHYDTGIVELLVADSENVIPIAVGIGGSVLLAGAAGAAGAAVCICKKKQGKGSETQEIQREIETSKNDTCAVEMKPLNEAE